MLYLILILVRIISFISRIFNLGSGGTWPGHVALTFYPGILKKSKLFPPKGFVVITGTNGKTTTAKLVTHMLSNEGYKVVSNKSGANLLNGVVTSLLLDLSFLGKPRSDIGVFEVDEFALIEVLNKLTPKVLVLLNLSRDQLDRYGEIDIIFDKWLESLEKLNPSVQVVADITQDLFKRIPDSFLGKVTYFNDSTLYLGKAKLPGSFNAKNINASLVVCSLLGLEVEKCADSLENFKPAYGRGEKITYGSKTYQLLLTKNPSSFDNNMELLLEDPGTYDTVFFILNDGIPDGRDVSWIYDVNPELLKQISASKTIYVSGSRCLDMAVRLKYAGVAEESLKISTNLMETVKHINKNNQTRSIAVLPNYSSMLELRKILVGRKIL